MMATQSAVGSYTMAQNFSNSFFKDWNESATEELDLASETRAYRNDIETGVKPALKPSQSKDSANAIKVRSGSSQRASRKPFLGSAIPDSDTEWSTQGIELLMAYYQNPSVELRNRLVRLNAGLVRKVAHRLRHQCAEPYEDLEQIGYLGLIRAIERFDPTQGCAFSSFAVPYIRGEMLHFLRDKSGVVKVPRRWQELHNEGEKAQKELTVKLGRSPRDAEIAQALEISLQEWRESKLAAQNRQPLSLDATVGQQVDCPVSLGEMLPDIRYQAFQYSEEDRQQLQCALSQLEEKTRAAIECVFLQDLPRKEAAKQIGVSPMTVTRHLQKGIEQLVVLLQPQTAELAS